MLEARRKLRRWQEQAFDAWKQAGDRGIVAAVTGSGKTTFALHCLDSYRRSVPGVTSLIVVPTTALLEQWLEEIVNYFEIPLSHVAVLVKSRRVRAGRINLGVINTVAQLQDKSSTEPIFLVVDECHRAASEVFREIFQFPRVASLGLSATPERQYDSGLEEVLVPHIGPVIFRYTYREALTDGVIVPFSLVNVIFDFEPEVAEHYEKLTKGIRIAVEKFGMESPEVVQLLLKRTRVSNLSLRRIQIATSLVARNRSKRALLFHEDTAACDLIYRLLQENEVSTGVYHSRLTVPERINALASFRSGDIEVLVTCRALDEGFNVPEAEIGIVAASTATYRQRIQRLGRVLRPAEGKNKATIYSVVASVPEIRRLAEEAEDLEGVAEVKWTSA